jgi:HNH endonuclease
VSAPTERHQIQILLKLQRLLSEGVFVASYKYALLLALADLAVERGDDSGSPLEVPLTAMAEHFIRLYWRQARPYVPRGNPVEDAGGPMIAAETASSYGTNSAVLRQSTGSQAVILRKIGEVFPAKQGSLAELRRDPTTWSRLVKSVAITIEEMPLWKLQTIGDSDDEFLYDNHRGAKVTSIRLKAGVAFTLRRFHPFIEELVRGGWARFVAGLSQNKAMLGEAEDLTAFLFGTERASLEPYVPILLELQDGACFYCQASLVRKTGHVDHFIPWARYPVDLAHNFVLVHDACNKDKSNVLAAYDRLLGVSTVAIVMS